MKLHVLPYLAAGMGTVLMLLVTQGRQTGEDGSTILPLLTLLVVSEFAFFLTVIAAVVGVRHMRATAIKPLYAATIVFCALLAIRFMWLGIELWPL